MRRVRNIHNLMRGIYLLVIRLWLGYTMINGGQSILTFFSKEHKDFFQEWFGRLGFPAPLLFAFLAKGTEFICGILLCLGLFTRISSSLIAFVMLIATLVANIDYHVKERLIIEDGFVTISCFLFACLLVMNGAGRYSLDNLTFKNRYKLIWISFYLITLSQTNAVTKYSVFFNRFRKPSRPPFPEAAHFLVCRFSLTFSYSSLPFQDAVVAVQGTIALNGLLQCELSSRPGEFHPKSLIEPVVNWKTAPSMNRRKWSQVIFSEANDLDEAIQIAGENPVFEDGTGARIEVRPIKVMAGIND